MQPAKRAFPLCYWTGPRGKYWERGLQFLTSACQVRLHSEEDFAFLKINTGAAGRRSGDHAILQVFQFGAAGGERFVIRLNRSLSNEALLIGTIIHDILRRAKCPAHCYSERKR